MEFDGTLGNRWKMENDSPRTYFVRILENEVIWLKLESVV